MRSSRPLAYYGYALSALLILGVILVLGVAALANMEGEAVEEIATPLVFFGLVPAAVSGILALVATVAEPRRERPLARAGVLLVAAGAAYAAAVAIGPGTTAQWTVLASFVLIVAYCVYALHIFIRWRRLGSIPSPSRA